MTYFLGQFKNPQIDTDSQSPRIQKSLIFALRSLGVVLVVIAVLALRAEGQGVTSFDLYHLEGDDIYWQKKYDYPGSPDSLRQMVVRMLKSKFFTTNVFRSGQGYNGEIRNYQVDCRRYHRSYMSTPRAYCEGEWTGKFMVNVVPGGYEVTVYALYFEKTDPPVGHYGTKKTVKGRFVDAVTKRNRTLLKDGEFHNLTLMSLSLGDNFDIQNTIIPSESKD